MITAGCDVGSLTAKAVILQDNKLIASNIIRVKSTPYESAKTVLDTALDMCSLKLIDIDNICSTGYGRYDIPFSNMNKSEISCHGMGAFWCDNSIRTIIDIGGQDCKVIKVEKNGKVKDFVMNEKCAAGTGRSLEILSKNIGLDFSELGLVSLKSKKRNIEITNKCSIFMELEVMQLIYQNHKKHDIAYAINNAVAKRVVALVKTLGVENNVCITGGVSKNIGVVNSLEHLLNIKFKGFSVDPQLMGAIGASVYAAQSEDVIDE